MSNIFAGATDHYYIFPGKMSIQVPFPLLNLGRLSFMGYLIIVRIIPLTQKLPCSEDTHSALRTGPMHETQVSTGSKELASCHEPYERVYKLSAQLTEKMSYQENLLRHNRHTHCVTTIKTHKSDLTNKSC